MFVKAFVKFVETDDPSMTHFIGLKGQLHAEEDAGAYFLVDEIPHWMQTLTEKISIHQSCLVVRTRDQHQYVFTTDVD